jgi:hypothetical protein
MNDDGVRTNKEFLGLLKQLNASEAIPEILNALPTFAAILDSNRQIVFVNNASLEKTGFSSIEELLGRRPGEVLRCIHAIENDNQCGISENCKYCGAYQSIKQTLKNKVPVSSEFRVSSYINNKYMASDFMVTTSPLMLGDTVYMILSLNDISHEKRRKALERIFFHDAINKISSLNGFFQLIAGEEDIDTLKEHVAVASNVLHDLTDEILAQRQLAAAEHGELVVKKSLINSLVLLNKIVQQEKELEIAKNIEIIIDPNSVGASFVSDPILLNRVITNMLKNAIEASEPGEVISIAVSATPSIVTFKVHNSAFIPNDVQLQMFHRSFSTKGDNRGLGTYSIKLLTERYLDGKVYFESSHEKGTTFYIDIFI